MAGTTMADFDPLRRAGSCYNYISKVTVRNLNEVTTLRRGSRRIGLRVSSLFNSPLKQRARGHSWTIHLAKFRLASRCPSTSFRQQQYQ